MNWFLDSKLSFRLTSPVADASARQRVIEFLQREGFREISEANQVLTARRGGWGSFLLGGDPRRVPQTVQIEGVKVTYKIVTRFLWFSAADSDVFRTEARILDAFLENRFPEGPTMEEVQKFRLRVDWRNTLIMGLFFALSLVAMVLIMNNFKRQFNPPPPDLSSLTNQPSQPRK